MKKHDTVDPFYTKFKRSNSGLFYLILIGLSAAIAGNAFRKDHGLLLSTALVVLLILATLFIRRLARGL